MKFTTTDGFVFTKDDKLTQIRVTNNRRDRIVFSTLLFVFILCQFGAELEKCKDASHKPEWFNIILLGISLVGYISISIFILFRYVLTKSIKVSSIKKINIAEDLNGLETTLRITLNSKRFKIYKFRRLENQYQQLVEHLKSINSNIEIIKLQ